MGGDKAVSEIYAATLITLTLQLLFTSNSGAGSVAMPLGGIEWVCSMFRIWYLPELD